MTWQSLARYLKEHWCAFVCSSALGGGVAVLLTPWFLKLTWVRSSLASESLMLPLGVFLLTLALSLPAWPRAVDIWRRYLRTQALERPPIQHADLIVVGIFFAVLVGVALIYTEPNPPPISIPAYISFVCLVFLLLAFVLSSWIWSYRPQILAETSFSAVRPEGDYPDDPITNDDQDLLGRVVFINRLFDQMLSLPSPHSFVLGLYGTWGEGKTSVLNLLQRRLIQESKTVTVIFNPWYLATEVALIHAFYTAIEQALQHRYILSGLHRTIKHYKDFLTFGLRYLGIQFPIKDDPERLRSEIESWVLRIGCRLVIIIDDIDRLQPDEMLAVFKLARLSARLQNTLFLLSFDPIIVMDTLKTKVEPEFLEKIIQKPVPLPPAEQRDIDRFLFFSDPDGPESHRSAIDRFLDELKVDPRRRKEFDDKMGSFYQTRLRRLFRTMRHAKRYLNALRATLPPIVGEVNLYDFFLLEALQVFFPKIYKDIWSSPWFYLPPWAQEVFLVYPFGLIRDDNEKYRLIQEHIQNLLDEEPQKDIAREILEELFFEIKNAFRPHARSDQSSLAQSYQVEKRLTHPKCFPRYFMFRMPAGEFADRVVEELIENWNTAPDPESLITDDFRRYRVAGQLIPLLEKLRVFRQMISPARVPAIVRALYRSVPDLSRVGTDPWTTEYGRVEGFLLLLIEERADPKEIRPLVEEVVGKVNSLPFAASAVLYCGRRETGGYLRIYENVNIQSLRRLVSERLCNHYVKGNRDIFEELSESDWGFVLYQWGTTWMTQSEENRPIVQNYVMDLIDRKPEYLGRLLRHFTQRTVSGEYLEFRFQQFIQVYDPSAIADRLDRYGKAALATPEAKEAAGLFRKHYYTYKSSSDTTKKQN